MTLSSEKEQTYRKVKAAQVDSSCFYFIFFALHLVTFLLVILMLLLFVLLHFEKFKTDLLFGKKNFDTFTVEIILFFGSEKFSFNFDFLLNTCIHL